MLGEQLIKNYIMCVGLVVNHWCDNGTVYRLHNKNMLQSIDGCYIIELVKKYQI
jgi:hypothetical protein